MMLILNWGGKIYGCMIFISGTILCIHEYKHHHHHHHVGLVAPLTTFPYRSSPQAGLPDSIRILT